VCVCVDCIDREESAAAMSPVISHSTSQRGDQASACSAGPPLVRNRREGKNYEIHKFGWWMEGKSEVRDANKMSEKGTKRR
jgi:hypothetical protein